MTSSNKSAKAVLYEKAENYEKTSEILLSQLRHDSSKFSKNLDIFLAFVQRTSSLVPPCKLIITTQIYTALILQLTENDFFSPFLISSTIWKLKTCKFTYRVLFVVSSDMFQCQKQFKLSLLSSILAHLMVCTIFL